MYPPTFICLRKKTIRTKLYPQESTAMMRGVGSVQKSLVLLSYFLRRRHAYNIMPRPSLQSFSRLHDGNSVAAVHSEFINSSTPIGKRKRIKDIDAIIPTVVTPEQNRVSPLIALVDVKQNGAYHELKNVSPSELRPSATLTTGQCFHWKAIENEDISARTHSKASAWGSHNATEWIGVIRLLDGNSVVLQIKETQANTMYRVLHSTSEDDLDVDAILHDYFQLDESLTQLYSQWSNSCPRLKAIASCIPGVRIVNQDPWECLISFICSSNNNIPRITKMLNALRQEYGNRLASIGNETLYSFPSFQVLNARATEEDLRNKCGMGYRAKYIIETIHILDQLGGEKYLHDLRAIEDPIVVQEKLLQFSGVGRKVADCVALFSLKQGDSIPVDTHVWNIARRDYDPECTLHDVKSLTPSVYRRVGDLFRMRFPVKSGWAHSLLFVAELPSFRPILPGGVLIEMDRFREKEQATKAATRAGKKQRSGPDS